MSELDFAQLLQMMQQNPTGSRQFMAETLRAQAGSDPRLTAMLDYMQRDEATNAPAPRDPSRAERIRAMFKEMREELVELHERNDVLADALGACPTCWGRVKHCGECRGRGRPGWRVPDPKLFEEFITPAITKRGEP